MGSLRPIFKVAIYILQGDIMIETHIFQVNLSAVVGEISEKKINRITNLGYEVQNQVPGVYAQFVKNGTNEPTVIVAQNQISLAIPRIMAVEDFLANDQAILGIFEPILDTLLLEWDGILATNLERSYTSQKNTFEVAKSKLNDQGEFNFSGALSVGFRIPFKREKMHGEFKVEPFFSNPSRFFMQAIVQCEIKNKEQASQAIVRTRNLLFDELQPKALSIFQ